MKRRTEKWYPFVLGAAAAVAFFAWELCCVPTMPSKMRDLLPAVINISAIAIGFTATTKSILFSMDDRPVFQQLKEINAIASIVDYMFSSIGWFFLLAMLSAALLLFESWTSMMSRLFFAVWLGNLTTAILSYYRLASIFAHLLKFGVTGLSKDSSSTQ